MCSDSAPCRAGHIDRSCGGPSAEMSFFRKPTVMNSDQGTGTGTGSGGGDEHDKRLDDNVAVIQGPKVDGWMTGPRDRVLY